MIERQRDPSDSPRGRIRRQILRWRQELPPAEVARMGEELTRRCLELAESVAPEVVCSYLSTPGEAPTADLCRWVLASGRRLVTPRVERGASSMTLHEILDLDRDVAPGLWGIPTPHLACPIVEPEAIDLVLVPGLAFDSDRNRLGFGAGYYDRFLAAAAPVTSIGLFFTAQQVDTCHPQPWDTPLTHVVTEQGVL